MKEVIRISAGRNVNTKSQSWCTPQKYCDAVYEFFNGIPNLDPCSNDDSILNASMKFILPVNGLEKDWNYGSVYINPPYGRDKDMGTTIKDWFKKAYDTYTSCNNEILMLVPVATNTSHWKDYVFGKATSICFLYDTRLKFRIGGNEDNKGCPMSCCIIYYGKDIGRFKDIFSKFGYVISV